MTSRRARIAAGGAALALLGIGAPLAGAVTSATLPADDGTALALAPGQPPTITQFQPQPKVGSDKPFSANIVGPNGAQVASVGCSVAGSTRTLFPEYAGNGAYVITVAEHPDRNCATPGAVTRYDYNVAPTVTLPTYNGRFLIRAPKTYRTRELELPIPANPGGGSIEIHYRLNGKVGADGALIGTTRQGYHDRERGIAPLRFPTPGTYTVVARVRSGSNASPWSAPIQIRTMAPFDLASVTFPDSRGPSYQLRGRLYDAAAAGGRVRISIAPGKRGGKFRSLGVAPITRKGTFVKRFTVTRPGPYRLRYVYAGSPRVLKAQVTQQITIRRSYFRS